MNKIKKGALIVGVLAVVVGAAIFINPSFGALVSGIAIAVAYTLGEHNAK
jgi:hypothetical protein